MVKTAWEWVLCAKPLGFTGAICHAMTRPFGCEFGLGRALGVSEVRNVVFHRIVFVAFAAMLLCVTAISGSAIANNVASLSSFGLVWTPQALESVSNGSRSVLLTTTLPNNASAVIVDISLDAEEAEALKLGMGEGLPVVYESDLRVGDDAGVSSDDVLFESSGGGVSSSVEYAADSNLLLIMSGTNPNVAEDSGKEELEDSGSIAAEEETSLSERTDGASDGAVLRLLTEGNSDSAATGSSFNLAFSIPNDPSGTDDSLHSAEPARDLKIEVGSGDVFYKTYGGDATSAAALGASDIPGILDVSLLNDSNATPYIGGLTPFTVYETAPQALIVTADPEAYSDFNKEIDFSFTAEILKRSGADGTGSGDTSAGFDIYSFALALPEQLSLPEGGYAVEESTDSATIKCGNMTVATVSGLPTGAKVDNVSRSSAQSLTFSVSIPKETDPVIDAFYHELSLSVDGASLTRTPDAFTDVAISLSVTPFGNSGSEVKATATVSASKAEGPNDGGWGIEVVERGSLSQDVFWNDNNSASRPQWGWGEGKLHPRLYFTIDGVEHELTEATMEIVGLVAMPELSQSSVSTTLTVFELPTKIKQTSADQDGETFDVSWRIAPPSTVPSSYTFLNLTAADVGFGHNYSSVDTPGWYFVLQDTFTFRAEVKQGDNQALVADVVQELMEFFDFNWSYGANKTGSDNILDMIEDHTVEATFDPGTHTVTIEGLWAYNVDGSPITYKVVENGMTSDGAITQGDLESVPGFPADVLEENDSYAIQYDNAGVPNYGDKADAVYDGGALRLVRQGDTSYTATKIWLDPYTQNYIGDGRPTATYALYRYREDQGINTASKVQDVTAKLVWAGGDTESGEDAHWEVRVVESADSDNSVQLEKYDPMDGYRWIYVTKEFLSGDNAGQYQQVFGKVDTSGDDGALGKVILGTDKGPEEDNWERQEGDTYLYNGGTLTNQMKDSVPVPVTKVWNAASFQSTFDNSAVELTLQYRAKNAGDGDPGSWENYEDSDGKEWVRYLTGFSAVHLTRSLESVPAMPRYRIMSDGRTQEVEYRWIETAVYEDAPDATETELGQGASESPYEVGGYTDNTNEGFFEVTDTSRTYRVEVDTSTIGSDGPLATTITNTLEDTLDYEVIKEWQSGTTPGEITIQIYQAVTGGDFNYGEPYLAFTMREGDAAFSDDATQGPSGETLERCADWWVTVKGLPRYDDEGRAYEYLLLEQTQGQNVFPKYKTEILDNGDYRTTVINGVGEGGFSFMVRKVWKDDSDIQHRAPVTFTVYNKHTNQPIKLNGGSVYTVTIGDDGVWHQVVWANRGDLSEESKKDGNGNAIAEFGANDIYVVETSIGESGDSEGYPVSHGNSGVITYKGLYGEDGSGGDEYGDVTTNNHRYEVTYKSEGSGASGSMRTFAVTNRRLGNVDITATKTWVDGRRTSNQDGTESGDTLSEQIAELVQDIKEKGGKNLALVFEVDFESADPNSGWSISRTGGLSEEDAVQVGGTPVKIYKNYRTGDTTTTNPGSNLEADNAAWRTYGAYGSSQQIIIGLDDDNAVVSDSAYFYGLPKYDSEGKVVNYVVNEKWVEITTDDDGKQTTGDVSLENLASSASEEELKDLYTQLNNLWSDYVTTSTSAYEENIAKTAHTRDFQEVNLTNTRSDAKTITWTKDWEDHFTHSNNQRPDLYLDIYRVAHYEEGDDYVCKIEKYMSTGDWVADENDNSKLTITLSVPEFDDNGIEYVYYAAERTVMSAGDYDYAAGRYSIEGENGTVEQLGTRDEPAESVSVLDAKDAVDNLKQYKLLDLDAQGEGAIVWKNESDKPSNIGSFGSENDYPRYALIEGGTFTNSLENIYKIEGMKYWTNLPSGWEDARLPSVTFRVYRTTDGNEPSYEANSEVATLTVKSEAWEKIRQGNGFAYSIECGGESTLGVEDGEAKYVYTEGASELPRYDEHGKLYTYYVTEEANLSNTAAGEANGTVFQPNGTGFSFTNAYNPDKGTIKVKKFLYLPMKTENGVQTPEAYPAVTFKLTRQVSDGQSGYKDDDAFGELTKTISSSDVQKAWDSLESGSAGKADGYVTLNLGFGELPLYAPDGSKYLYTVEEVKTELNGYDTWAGKGDAVAPAGMNDKRASVNELEPVSDDAVVATFKNEQPESPSEFESFSGTKKWDDFNDKFGFRPAQDSYKQLLTLKRSAESQTGQNNAIEPEEVLCEIDWTTAEDSDAWNFTITPANGGAFEKYAPNGMPWKYELSEPLVEETGKLQLDASGSDAESNKVYLPSTSNGAWPTTIVGSSQQQNANFGTLTNSTSGKAWFEKKWVDSDNKEIAENYLGFELSVTFKLQVSIDNGSNWGDASTNGYVAGAVGTEYAFVQTITDAVTDNWKGSFNNLPTIAKDTSNNNVYLAYRVVETAVSYGSTTQTVTIDTNDSYTLTPTDALVTSASFEKIGNMSVSTNKLSTASVSVKKVWDDGSNQYGTRPGASGPSTWSAWFVLQRSSDGGDTWANVAVFDKLFGQNQNSINDSPTYGTWTAIIDGLPVADYSGAEFKSYDYRVRELQPPASGDGYTLEDVTPNAIVDEGDLFNSEGSAYATEYAVSDDKSVWTVTNALDLYTPDPDSPLTNLRAVKQWVGGDKNGSVNSVTFQLQYRENEGWQKVPFGSAEQTANEGNGWTVSWDNLPSTYNGKEVEYRIVENAGSGWVQLAEPKGDADGDTYTYAFTNSVTRDYEVEKVWNPNTATPSGNVSVTVGLFRTANPDQVGSASGEPVPESETNANSLQRTVQLSSSNGWSFIFEELPKYNEEGKEYYYYALEMSDGEPVSQLGTVEIGGKDYSVTYDFDKPQSGFFAGLLDLFTGNDPYEKTTITNTSTTELQGTKEWLDNSNAYGTRPESVEVEFTLQRTTASNPTESNWKSVSLGAEGIEFAWENTGGDAWTFTYANLPTVDGNGTRYTYRVVEDELSGYEASYNGNTITNTLTGTVTINGTKTWVGGKAENDPALTLERRLAGSTSESDWQEVGNATATWNEDLTTFTFSNLPKYDGRGKLYEYRVREVLSGYEVAYGQGAATDGDGCAETNANGVTQVDGAVITNYKDGELEITKTVSGNRGGTTRKFAFALTLSGTSSAGTSADSLAGESFSYVVTNEDGDQVGSGGTLTFAALSEDPDDPDASGNAVVSDQFNLSHGQTLTVSGLPAGISYKVTEVDANKDGYSTSSTNAAGTVPAGGVSEVKFHNSNHVTPSVDVPGTKTWADDSDAAGLRPDSIELVLYRNVAGSEEQVVEGVEPVWTKNGDTWSYVFSNVPEQDAYGRTYTYRVQEVTPDGYTATYDGNNITNTLGERVDVSGTKTWTGDDEASRPESITVTLYANGEPVDTVTVAAADGWAYSFGSLPRYDADGNEIAYTVVETPVPEGYEAVYNGFDVTNSSVETVGSLRVTKQVVGSEGETDREFSFTVTLGDSSINGVYGDMTFVNGVASITLRHGQSVVATGLPAGVHYDVNETAVDGYEISATGQTGSIVADAEVVAAFTNSKGSVPDAPSNTETPGEPSGPNEPDPPSASDGSGMSSGPFASLLPSTGDRLAMVMALLALSAVSLGGFAAYAGKKRSPYRGKHACRPTGRK